MPTYHLTTQRHGDPRSSLKVFDGTSAEAESRAAFDSAKATSNIWYARLARQETPSHAVVRIDSYIR